MFSTWGKIFFPKCLVRPSHGIFGRKEMENGKLLRKAGFSKGPGYSQGPDSCVRGMKKGDVRVD